MLWTYITDVECIFLAWGGGAQKKAFQSLRTGYVDHRLQSRGALPVNTRQRYSLWDATETRHKRNTPLVREPEVEKTSVGWPVQTVMEPSE